MKKQHWLGLAAAVGVSTVALIGCSEQQQIRDLEDVPQTDPDKVRLVTNVDTYPNVVAICVEGEGFVTTTRDYNAIIPVPAWGEAGGWCVNGDDGATVVP